MPRYIVERTFRDAFDLSPDASGERLLHQTVSPTNDRRVTGMFQDFNPKVRLCPEGVPLFGVDLP